MRISFIGKFGRLYDEEYIARSLESLGHEVQRITERHIPERMIELMDEFKPDILLCTKLTIVQPEKIFAYCKDRIPTVSWNFDLYWDYHREERIPKVQGFKCDYVFTSDGGHQDRWEVNHQCVRQGIYKEDCYLVEGEPKDTVIFVGSQNPFFPERQKMMEFLGNRYDFHWYGKLDTNEVRNEQLNNLYANNKVVVGDSVYSPYYWSNRVVETLGRGGFLIHQEVEGLKEEYPYLVTYERGSLDDLKDKINYYLSHEDERKQIVQKNFEWVRDNYTMDKKCAELLSKI